MREQRKQPGRLCSTLWCIDELRGVQLGWGGAEEARASSNIDNLSIPLSSLSPMWHTHATYAAPRERSALSSETVTQWGLDRGIVSIVMRCTACHPSLLPPVGHGAFWQRSATQSIPRRNGLLQGSFDGVTLRPAR